MGTCCQQHCARGAEECLSSAPLRQDSKEIHIRQGVEHFPRSLEALGLIPSTKNSDEEEEEKGEEEEEEKDEEDDDDDEEDDNRQTDRKN